VASFADALESASFDEAKAKEGGELRVKSAERLREAVLSARSGVSTPRSTRTSESACPTSFVPVP
jgi:hypothetical protein